MTGHELLHGSYKREDNGELCSIFQAGEMVLCVGSGGGISPGKVIDDAVVELIGKAPLGASKGRITAHNDLVVVQWDNGQSWKRVRKDPAD